MKKTVLREYAKLIVRCGAIEINCSLRALFDQIRPALETKVSRKLFPDKLEKKGS